MKKYNQNTMEEEITITKQHIILYKIGMFETLDIVDKGQKYYMPIFFREINSYYDTLDNMLDYTPFKMTITT